MCIYNDSGCSNFLTLEIVSRGSLIDRHRLSLSLTWLYEKKTYAETAVTDRRGTKAAGEKAVADATTMDRTAALNFIVFGQCRRFQLICCNFKSWPRTFSNKLTTCFTRDPN